jgi:hypothetical protein
MGEDHGEDIDHLPIAVAGPRATARRRCGGGEFPSPRDFVDAISTVLGMTSRSG